MSQIMDLLNLAPEMQDQFLRLSETERSVRFSERAIRSLDVDRWCDQQTTLSGIFLVPENR